MGQFYFIAKGAKSLFAIRHSLFARCPARVPGFSLGIVLAV